MFHNPFNSKIVEDISKFLQDHRAENNIQPCLDEKAKEAASVVLEQVVLEERRNTLVKLFNEAVSACKCRGTNQEATEFVKAVETHMEAIKSKKIVVPAGKVSNPSPQANELENPASVKTKTAAPQSQKSIGKNDGLAGKGKNPPKIGG
jgi:hypothetical protein